MAAMNENIEYAGKTFMAAIKKTKNQPTQNLRESQSESPETLTP